MKLIRIGIDDKLTALIAACFLASICCFAWTASIKDDRTQELEKRLEAIERMLEDGC